MIPTTTDQHGSHQPPATTTTTNLTAAQVARIEDAAAAAKALNTRRQYRSAWNAFADWCQEGGHQSIPAAPETVAAYLTHLADTGKAGSTIAAARAAVGSVHRDAGAADPTKHEGVRRVLAGLRRQTIGRGRGQATGLSADDVAGMLAVADLPRRSGRGTESQTAAETRGAIDKVIVALLFQGGLRRSEAAALTWGDVQDTAGGAMLITVATSKTNQHGDRADVRYLKNGCASAVRRLRDRLTVMASGRPAAAEKVLGGLNDQSVARRITAAARAAGIVGRITGHSGRVGLATELTSRGASTTETMLAGGWQTARMVAHYAAGAAAENGAVAKYL